MDAPWAFHRFSQFAPELIQKSPRHPRGLGVSAELTRFQFKILSRSGTAPTGFNATALGYDVQMCLIDFAETAEAVQRWGLSEKVERPTQF